MYRRISAGTCVYVRIHLDIFGGMCVYVYVYLYIYTCIHIHIHIYIYIYIHTHKFIHICTYILRDFEDSEIA